MQKTTIKIIKITASEGMILTNGEVYSDEVYLSVNDSADNWHEITVEEYNAIKAKDEEV